MPSLFTFRLSTYLTLALACLALGYSEWDLLPEVTVLTATILIILGVSFVLDRRMELENHQANRIGMVIGVIAAAWISWQMLRPTGGLVAILPWPASLLPYFGPLLMVLMPAKLMRPKHTGDWWAMHAIALAAVGLGCAITDDGIFATLVILYAMAAVWSVSLFLWHRWSGGVAPLPNSPKEPAVALVHGSLPIAGRRQMKTVLTWMFAGGSFALVLFFLTPASPGAKWQLSARPQMETGLPLEPVVDLNMIGELKVNRDVAFEVFASFPEGGSKDDLNPNTYWRASAYNEYDNGRWTQAQVGHLFAIRDQFSTTTTLPDLGPGQYYLDYRPTPKLVREVFAEPLCWTPGQASPIISIGLTSVRPWRQLPNGWFVPLVSTTGRIVRYRQVMKPVTDPNIGPPNELLPSAPFARVGQDALPPLREARMPRLREWAEARVREFVANGKLPDTVLERARFDPVVRRLQVDPQDYERVALAFREYFARTGGFTYALKLSREDTSLDPIEDFVFNTKAGHCERFASAFALSLRTLGIPCSFVLGYHGCDFEGEGKYIVRQENAHAWVSVLVPRPTPQNFVSAPRLDGLPPQPPENVWCWLTVDPTPSGEDIASTTGPTTWWQAAHLTGQAFYNDFIIGYDAERRRQITQSITGHFAEYWWAYAGGIAGILGLVAGVVSVRRMSGPPELPPVVEMTGIVTIPWYAHAVNALEAAGFPMQTGQTPLEYANRIAALFREHPDTMHLGSDMLELTEALYRSRYAGATLPAFEVDALTAAAERVAGGIAKLIPQPEPEAPNV